MQRLVRRRPSHSVLREGRLAPADLTVCPYSRDLMPEAAAALLRHDQLAARKPHRDHAVLLGPFGPKPRPVTFDGRDAVARPGVRHQLFVHPVLVRAREFDPQFLFTQGEHLELAGLRTPRAVDLRGGDGLLHSGRGAWWGGKEDPEREEQEKGFQAPSCARWEQPFAIHAGKVSCVREDAERSRSAGPRTA